MDDPPNDVEDRLTPLTAAVADGVDVDWADAESTALNPTERAMILQLRALARLAAVFRSQAAPNAATLPETAVSEPNAHRESPPDTGNGLPLESWGHFKIRSQIGSGSFGTVFRAWEPGLEREFALKVLHSKSLTRDDAALKEARLLARIRHHNVVTIFGVDCFDSRVGFWMELVNGRTLKAVLNDQGPFSAQEAMVFGLDLCRALAAVHQAGFIHRDVKAQNVMREEGGRIVLMDFGAATVAKVGAYPTVDVKGTPLYLAPEVFHGAAPSVQSDLYSLGVLLYYLVSGEFPVAGNSLDDIRMAHLEGRRRSLRDARADLPAAFVRIVDDATAVLPGQRPASAGIMEAWLEHAVGRGTSGRGTATITPESGGPGQSPSIAVLPFVDMSPEGNLEFFCHGIAEEISNALTSVSGLRVIAHHSALPLKSTDDLRSRIVSVLNVATVLEGSVRTSGNRLRVISRLINAADGRHLWSERFDRSLEDVFAVQDEIAKATVSALGIRVKRESRDVPPLATPRTRDLDAYTSYLKGRHYWNQRTEAALLKSVACFQAAIEKDSSYADAFAGLAEAYATMATYGVLPPHEIMPQAKAAARRAIEIDATMSNPLATLGCVAAVYDWAWAEAEHHYRRAIELNPEHPAAHHGYAVNYLLPLKRFAEAETELWRAVEADPLSMPIRVSLGLRSYFARKYAQARDELQDSFEVDAGSAIAHLFLGLTLVEMGSCDEAVPELECALRVARSPEMIAALGYAFARAGKADRARQSLGELMAVAELRYVSGSLIAQVHAGLGEPTHAFDWLEKASDAHAAELAWLPVRPVFDALRSEPRFDALLQRLGH
jgi:serine/threonine protein kinase/Flp pilus assembly protein TadD